jgi:DNA invertase Pin-like site-specific DNA recombinase
VARRRTSRNESPGIGPPDALGGLCIFVLVHAQEEECTMKLHFNSSGPATKTLSAAIYARVSTANNGQDPTMQTRELSEYCGRRGWRIAGEYVDLGISGTKERRPELDRLMADAHQRRFDVVVVWRFDRFARSVSHLLRALETFKALGVEFVSFSEQLDTSTPAGKMVFTVLGAVAELERSLIVERVKAGLRNARSKGRHLGRPRAIVDTQKIASLRGQGHSWRQIARQMGVSARTARRAGQKATLESAVLRALSAAAG